MSDRVVIFDTTLRDGEQSPGASMNIQEKVEVALQLARLGVDIIEAGFPISSPGDFEGVRKVAQQVTGPVVCGLARCAVKDIDRAGEALKDAKRARIHTFIATSDIHMEHKLRKTRDEVLEMAAVSVARAKQYTDDVEFSPEDATRSDVDFMCRVVETAIAAGATTVNIPDTVGYTTPTEYAQLILDLKAKVPNIDKAVISVHCHNDLGLAVANSLAAVQAGARQIECTINGLGERAGNCALEEVVMALRTRPQLYQITTGIKTEEIIRASRMVSEITGILVQPNKAIVGSNAFAHEAGIHQHGVLAERSTYEIMDPASVGLVSNKLVLGKHSGRHAFDARLKELGLEIGDEEMARAFERFKELCDKKKQVFDEDIEALVADEVHTFPEEYKLDVMTVTSALPGMPTAAIRLKHGDGTVQAAEIGVGSVDAVFRTLDAMVQVPHELEDYTVKSITGGTDAMAEVTVKLRDNGRLFTGRGAALDIIVASAKAYLQAINKLVDYGQHRGAAVNPKEAADLTV